MTCFDRVTVERAHPNRSGGGGGGGGGGGSSYGGGDRRRSGGYSSRFGAPYNTEWRVIVENLSSRAGWQVNNIFNIK